MLRPLRRRRVVLFDAIADDYLLNLVARGQQGSDDDFQARLFFVALCVKQLPLLDATEFEWEVFLRSWQQEPEAWPGYSPAPGDPTMPDGRHWDRGAARVQRVLGSDLIEMLKRG